MKGKVGPTGKGVTNDTPGSCVEVMVDCDVFWSAAHQFSWMRLSEPPKTNNPQCEEDLKVKLLDGYHTRARRIAATYARFYLETEKGGDPSKEGRYYWMALGAFASKTVACLLDRIQIKGSFWAGQIFDDLCEGDDLNLISEGLALGNFWLFMDIATWHYFYSKYQRHFFNGMACATKRDAQELLGNVKKVVTEDLQWAKYALPKINDLKSTPYLLDGMKQVEKIENANNSGLRAKFQLDHLLAIADHEQREILQKLIYEHAGFAGWLLFERKPRQTKFLPEWLKEFVLVSYQLVFTSGCHTDNEALKSVAPNDIVLENVRSRMDWIEVAGGKFHKLMQSNEWQGFMRAQLVDIAGWYQEEDEPSARYAHPSSFK